MRVKELIEKLLQQNMDSEVVVDLDDSMDKNYQSVNSVMAETLEITQTTIVILEHRW